MAVDYKAIADRVKVNVAAELTNKVRFSLLMVSLP